MPLETLLSNNYTKGALAVTLASSLDYALTYYGLNSGQIEELNPVINNSMDYLGTHGGLLIPKLAGLGIILTASKIIDIKCNRGETNVKSEYVLYPISIAYLVVGTSWVWEKYLG